MKKIIDNIYSFILPLPFTNTTKLTLYYIDGKKPALIDAGMGDPRSMGIISSELKKIDKSIKDISIIINTHEHVEHFGGDKKLKEASGGSIIASSTAAQKIQNSKKLDSDLKNYLSRYEPDLAEELKKEIDSDLRIDESEVDIRVEDGDIIEAGDLKLRVIGTPGHTAGHICLYNKELKILFSGDLLITKGSTFVGYDYREIASQRIVDVFNTDFNKPDNLSLYIESIKRLRVLDIDIILPGHGEPITDPYKKLDQEIRKKERRSGIFLKVLEKKKEISLKELTAKVYGRNNNGLIHRGSALGYLARLNRSGIIEADMRRDDLYLKIKSS